MQSHGVPVVIDAALLTTFPFVDNFVTTLDDFRTSLYKHALEICLRLKTNTIIVGLSGAENYQRVTILASISFAISWALKSRLTKFCRKMYNLEIRKSCNFRTTNYLHSLTYVQRFRKTYVKKCVVISFRSI